MIPFQVWCLIISPPVGLWVFGGTVSNSPFQGNSDLSLTRKSKYFFNFSLGSFDFPLISFCKVKAYLEISNMISVFMSLCEQSAWLLTVWGEGQTLLSHPRHFCEEVDWSETGKNPSGYCVDPTNRVSVASTPQYVCVCVCACMHMRLTLCNPIDCSPSGSSVHGVFQARKLKCFAVSYSRGSSKPRDQS